MAPPACRSYSLLLHGLIKFLTVLFIFSLSILPPKSDGSMLILKRAIMVESKVGSSPPACVNKCMKCRPCMATLVNSNNNDPRGNKNKNKNHFIKSSHGDDDTYYLLHWKCRCGNKLYQP
ncbi:hypothetical protein HN51_053335 [Arachis hypogaea]|uniref:Epidermal patterning factor-like protein n=2 Tax=Arachis hypogaea TaxID=3818 RepID=A0A6B9V5X8_ARAHY|nr:EPIDERMAL PATTERNING FACTOR-like protein 1 [Arachis ipaensis]XP_025677117.1 EPIDERMAL PATTERNING FACTOR-like protein 1 [Arachis hypogaea]QHN75662.1 EPIDERMAL PATTERNING FACTOR-like protein [Arachis hypogaea]